MKILISLIVLPEIICAQPLIQLAEVSPQVIVCNAQSTIACGENHTVRQFELNKYQFIDIARLSGATARSTVFYSPERFEYQTENIDYDSYRLDDSFTVRSPCADYSCSDHNDEDSTLAVENSDVKAPTFLIKPLQLLNLLAEEDVTLYEAADILRISVHTANKYVAKIKSDFGVLTLPAAILYAAREGLISKPVDKTI